MSHHNTAFHQLLQPLSRHDFGRAAREHHVGQKLRSASRWVHQSKAGVKLHAGLNNASLISEFVALSDGREGDLIQGHQFTFPAGSIVAFDKGHVDYHWYGELTKQKIIFVTRLRPKAVYQVLKSNPVRAEMSVEYDQVIELSSRHAQKQGAPKLRLVGYNCPESGKHFRFMTNNFKLAATTIAAIYKDRWQVELLFKALKQNLKIKAFLGNSKNAVLTQI